MTRNIVPLILAGGSGKRLWPLSRPALPKQFIPDLSRPGESLFGAALRRIAGIRRLGPPVVLCGEAHLPLVKEELARDGIAPCAIIAEPSSRNTAPAVAAAIHHLLKSGGDAIVAMLPADHLIRGESAFMDSIGIASEVAASGHLALLGILPAAPSEAYGYIRAARAIDGFHDTAFSVETFAEKPGGNMAEAYIAQGGWFWNSGMLAASAKLLAGELARHAPELWEAARRAVDNAVRDGDALRLDARAYEAAPDISLDYALLEKTRRAAVVPAQFEWSDLGAWDSLWSALPGLEKGEIVLAEKCGLRAVLHAIPARESLRGTAPDTGGECWLVAERDFLVTLGGAMYALKASACIAVPPGQRWESGNAGGCPLRVVEITVEEFRPRAGP